MNTPGSEPTLSIFVLGTYGARSQPLVRRLCRRAWHRDDMRVVYRQRYLDEDWEGYNHPPSWATIERSTRLLSFQHMIHAFNNFAEVAWHLNQSDVVILVILASSPSNVRDVMLAAVVRGIQHVIILLDTGDMTNPDEIDRVEREVRMTLILASLPGDDVPVLRGDVLACRDAAPHDVSWRLIDDVYTAIDTYFPTPRFDSEGPMRFVVRHQGAKGEAHEQRGRIDSGVMKCGESYHLHLLDSVYPVTITRIERFGQSLDQASAGQNVAILATAGETGSSSFGVGAVIATPGHVRLSKSFTARLTFFTHTEGGRGRYVMSGFTPSFLLPTARRKARIELLDRLRAEPGETFPIRAVFRDQRAALVMAGEHFLCRDNGQVIGYGVVQE